VKVLLINGDVNILIDLSFNDLIHRDVHKPLHWDLLDLFNVNWFFDNFLVRDFNYFLDRDLHDLLNRLLHDDLGDNITLDDLFYWHLHDYVIWNLYLTDDRYRILNHNVNWLLNDDLLDNSIFLLELHISVLKIYVVNTWSDFSAR
jgi:hypothetical protein